MKKFIIKLYYNFSPDRYVGIDEDYTFSAVKRKEDAFRFRSFSDAILAKNIYLEDTRRKEFTIEEVEE